MNSRPPLRVVSQSARGDAIQGLAFRRHPDFAAGDVVDPDSDAPSLPGHPQALFALLQRFMCRKQLPVSIDHPSLRTPLYLPHHARHQTAQDQNRPLQAVVRHRDGQSPKGREEEKIGCDGRAHGGDDSRS